MLDGAVRRVVVLVSAIVLLDVVFYSAITPLLASYVDDLGITKSDAGVLSGAYALGTLVASLPAGWVAARWGARRTLLAGLGVLAVASVAFGLGESFGVLVGARLLQGVGGAGSWAAALAWLVEVAPRDRRGQLIGVVLGAGIAGAVGGPVLGALADALTPEVVFPAVGVLALVLAAAVLRSPAGGAAPPSGDLLRALRDPRVRAGAWLTALSAAFFGVVGVLVPLRLDGLGATSAGVAALFLVAAAAEAAVSPLVGRLSDRRGRLLPIRIGLVGVLVACLVLPVPGVAWVLAAVVVVAAATAGSLMTPASAMLSDAADRAGLAQGLAFGLFNLAWAGGQVTGSAGGARLADATTDAAPYLVLAGLAAVTLVLITRRRRRTPVPEHP